jgi:uncharacterized protein YjbI with pentapeptide repeats
MNKSLFTFVFLISLLAPFSFELNSMEACGDPDAEVPRPPADPIMYDQEAYNGILAGNKKMAGVNLVGARFPEGADLSGIDLTGAKLDAVFLQQANMEGARCDGAIFRGAHLEHATLDEASALKAVFTDAHVESATFVGAALIEANFRGNKFLIRTSLVRAKLNKACFAGALINNVSFIEADLDETDFERATLEHSVFAAKSLNRTKFKHSTIILSKFYALLCDYVDFRYAKMQDTFFGKVGFDETLLCSTEIICSEPSSAFEDCYLQRTDFTDAFFKNVCFKNSQILGFSFKKCERGRWLKWGLRVVGTAVVIACTGGGGLLALKLVAEGAKTGVMVGTAVFGGAIGLGIGLGVATCGSSFIDSRKRKEALAQIEKEGTACKSLESIRDMQDCYFEVENLEIIGGVADAFKLHGASFERGNRHRNQFLKPIMEAGIIAVLEGTAEAFCGPVLGRVAGGVARGFAERAGR